MYDIKDLQNEQLEYIKNVFPEAEHVAISQKTTTYAFGQAVCPKGDTLDVTLENGSFVQIVLDKHAHCYRYYVNDERFGCESLDNDGSQTIYDTIKRGIRTDDEFIDSQVAYQIA